MSRPFAIIASAWFFAVKWSPVTITFNKPYFTWRLALMKYRLMTKP